MGKGKNALWRIFAFRKYCKNIPNLISILFRTTGKLVMFMLGIHFIFHIIIEVREVRHTVPATAAELKEE